MLGFSSVAFTPLLSTWSIPRLHRHAIFGKVPVSDTCQASILVRLAGLRCPSFSLSLSLSSTWHGHGGHAIVKTKIHKLFSFYVFSLMLNLFYGNLESLKLVFLLCFQFDVECSLFKLLVRTLNILCVLLYYFKCQFTYLQFLHNLNSTHKHILCLKICLNIKFN